MMALRVLAIAAALFLGGFLLVWGLDFARRVAAPPAPALTASVAPLDGALQVELSKVQAERDRLAAAVKDAAVKSDASKKAQERQASQIKALELENSKLNQDLASLKHPAPAAPVAPLAAPAGLKAATQLAAKAPVKDGAQVPLSEQAKLAPPHAANTVTQDGGKAGARAKLAAAKVPAARAGLKPGHGGAAIRRAEAKLSAPNQLHYRLLITGGAKKAAPAVGHLQFVLKVVRAGKPAVLKFPSAGAANTPQFVIKLGKLQRCEGSLTLPDGVSIKSIQARMLEKGQLRSQQSVTLKDAAHVRS